MTIQSTVKYFSLFERLLWLSSVILIAAFFIIFDRSNYLSLIASLVGATSLILNAKGNPIGQVLMVVFSILYGIISFSFAYYGEMITYLCMTAPMAIAALIAWLKNPYRKNEVKVGKISLRETIFMILLSIAVTVAFYFILTALKTANIIPSTLSVTTSFIAAYLTFRRSPYFALAYAANDIVLLVLWITATITDVSYLSVTICFAVFLVNDLYGFFNWLAMQKRQSENTNCN